MIDWTSGFVQFRAWLPTEIGRAFGPTTLPPEHARSLLTIAIGSFLIAFVARTAWRLQGWLVDVAAGRRLVVQLGGVFAFVTWLVGFIAIATPWATFKWSLGAGHVPPEALSSAAILALVWLILRALQRHQLYWLPRDQVVVLTRHARGFRTAESRVPVARLLGEDNATERAWLVDALGGERAAERYLTRLRKRLR